MLAVALRSQSMLTCQFPRTSVWTAWRSGPHGTADRRAATKASRPGERHMCPPAKES